MTLQNKTKIKIDSGNIFSELLHLNLGIRLGTMTRVTYIIFIGMKS